MPPNRLEFKPGLIDGKDWAFYFDADQGAKVTVDGKTIGELKTADFRPLLKLGKVKRDADIEAEEIIHALLRASVLPEAIHEFPSNGPLLGVVTAWLRT